MGSAHQFGFEEWLPRRAALLTGLGLWVTGFALAGASAWSMQHRATHTDEMGETPVSSAAIVCDEMPSETPAETAAPQGAVFMPADLVVGRKTPTTGVTQMQEP
jgi:hypothetical protein